VLGDWRGKEDTWPKLNKFARWILSAPATSTSFERISSTAGRTLERRRSQLNAETVDNLLFLYGVPSSQNSANSSIRWQTAMQLLDNWR